MGTKISIKDCCNKLIPSILDFMSTTELFVPEPWTSGMKDKEMQAKVNTYLKNTFVSKTIISKYICHFGMTFDRKTDAQREKDKPLFHFDYYDDKEIDTHAYKQWVDKYKNKVPLQMYKLLCEKEYWHVHKFPMILMYYKNKPYIVSTNPKRKKSIVSLTGKQHRTFFKKPDKSFKENLKKLHKIFEEEKWSNFKIFLTSNFRGLKSQTYIKFKKDVTFNIKDTDEAILLIRLCYLIDNVVGSIAYDFDRGINYHEYYNEILKHGTKSAVLSIDVRNLSHNIASHVLAYWIQELNQLLQDFSSDNGELQTAINKSKALFRYIQHRADFLAEVATSIPCSEMSLDLKKDILNPFLIDSDDGNPYKISTDNTKGGLPLDSNVYVLLRYIADSEGITINFGAEGKTKKTITYECNISSAPRVSIPSGIIGKHAIYSILENFIRNAAKHYKGSENGENFIKINVSEADKNHKNDYIKIEIIDIRKGSCKPKYVNDLKEFIEGGFVDEQGKLKSGGWGIKEMLISANFLRKNTPEDLYDIITGRKDCNPPLLEIICPSVETICALQKTEKEKDCPTCNNNHNLGIRFYLKRPKHLAVLMNNIPKDKVKKTVFEIKKITADEFKDKPIPYNILLVDKKTYNNKYKDKDDPLAPCRVMVYDGTDELKGCMEAYNKIRSNGYVISDEYYLCLYEKFIRKEISAFNNMKIVNDLDIGYKFVKTNYSLSEYKDTNGTKAKDNIVFKDHPEKDKTDIDFKESKYFQPMSGGFSTKAKFSKNQKLPVPIRDHFYLELIEAALTKVVIVDERISEWANKNSKYNFGQLECKTQRDMLKRMNVYVAKIEKENISNLGEKLKEGTLGCSVLKSENGAANKNIAHFFVIHQGILDKLDNKEFMDEIKCKWKVIDSGRGVPEGMEHRFVQISALQTLLENYDKHGLVQTLFSLRKPVKEGKSGN